MQKVDRFVHGGEEAEGPVASPASETETSCTARRGRSVSFVTLSSRDVGRKEWQNKNKKKSNKSQVAPRLRYYYHTPPPRPPQPYLHHAAKAAATGLAFYCLHFSHSPPFKRRFKLWVTTIDTDRETTVSAAARLTRL